MGDFVGWKFEFILDLIDKLAYSASVRTELTLHDITRAYDNELLIQIFGYVGDAGWWSFGNEHRPNAYKRRKGWKLVWFEDDIHISQLIWHSVSDWPVSVFANFDDMSTFSFKLILSTHLRVFSDYLEQLPGTFWRSKDSLLVVDLL